MLALFVIVAIAALALILAWNFIPAFRDKLKGWTTILEAILAGGVYWFGQISDGLREAQAAGYIPAGWLQYLPYVFLAYMVVKRLGTKTEAAPLKMVKAATK